MTISGSEKQTRPGKIRPALRNTAKENNKPEHIAEKRDSVRICCIWQGHKDLNPGHSVLETDALPTELYPYIVVDRQGLEPRTDRL